MPISRIVSSRSNLFNVIVSIYGFDFDASQLNWVTRAM